MKAFKIVFFLLGAFLFVWIIRKMGVQELLTGFHTLGWRLIVPILILFPCQLLQTGAWWLVVRRYHPGSVPFWGLFRVKIAGEAANTLTPLNFAGGDPVRIWLLSRQIPVPLSGASVIVDRTMQTLAIVALIFLGNLAALFNLDFPSSTKRLLAITATSLLLVTAFFIFQQTRGLFEKLVKLISRMKIRTFSEKTLSRIEEVDHQIGEFYRKDRGLFAVCFGLMLLSRLLAISEIITLARFLGVPMDLWEGLFFAAVIPVTNLLGSLVPGTLGVLEGVVSALFFALHWDPAQGLILQVARRLRAFVWILVGFFFIYQARRQEKKIHPSG